MDKKEMEILICKQNKYIRNLEEQIENYKEYVRIQNERYEEILKFCEENIK